MPPKRPLRRPPGPAVPPRTALHTQELILFSSPISGAPEAKRSSSTANKGLGHNSSNRRPSNTNATSASAVSAAVSHAPGGAKTRGSSQRRPPQPSTNFATTASRRPAPDYEPLPEHYHTVPNAPSAFSSEIAPAASTKSAIYATTPAAGALSSSISLTSPQTHGGRVPSPPPARTGGNAGTTRGPASASTSSGGGGIVASGASSRVVRLLRDARAAVQDPIRPETPLDSYGANSAAFTAGTSGVLASGGAAGGGAANFPRQPPHSLEPRLRRRLPAGGRLAPMPAAAASTASSATTTLSGAAGGSPLVSSSSTLTLPQASLSSQIDVRAHNHPSHGGHVAAGTSMEAAGLHAARTHAVVDADTFATCYAAAQQRGEEGLLDCVTLLGQLKVWLATPPPTAAVDAAPHTLTAAATACLQSTLLHFCQHWPTGAALRSAIDNYALLNGAATEEGQDSSTASLCFSSSHNHAVSGEVEGRGRERSRSLSSSVPLNYAEVALLAAAVMLRGYPAPSLVAEPISFQALLTSLHTIAECGVAEWIVQESQVIDVLVEVLSVLTQTYRSAAGAADATKREWIQRILEIITFCCEEAALAAAADPQADGDLIRGRGLTEDAGVRELASASGTQHQPQQRVASASLMSSTASLHRIGQRTTSRPGSHSPVNSSLIPQGSPLNMLRHGSSSGGGGIGGERAGQPASFSANSLKAFTTHLLSLGLLEVLNGLNAHALTQQQQQQQQHGTTDASLPDDAASLLPAIGSLYRLLAQHHAEALRRSGVLTTLTTILQLCGGQSRTVESAARALVKLSFDDECLLEMQDSGSALLDAAAHALLTQMRLHPKADTSSATIDLLVSRLCGVVARVAESREALQEHLAIPAMTHILEVLAQRYLSSNNSSSKNEAGAILGPTSPLPPTPVLQSIVWVLGIAAMSPKCSLHLVETVTPLLVSLLERLRELTAASSSVSPLSPAAVTATQATAVYVLMCLSNLSYFFNQLEPVEGSADATAARLAGLESEFHNGDASGAAAAAAARATWLPTICDALCFSLAAYLFEDNVEATVEATRILGNISYTNTGRDWMETNRCDEVIVLFLGHEDLRIVYNCCGVLLNLTAASPCRVVGDPALLKMMLSYTSRYTRDDTIAQAAALEKARLRKQRLQAAGTAASGVAEEEENDRACAAEASSSASQIADLVAKLLTNVQGLLSLPADVAEADADYI